MAVGRPSADFAREGGAGQHGLRHADAEHFVRDLVRQLARVEFEALGGPRDAHAVAQQRRDVLEAFAEAVARHGDQQFLRRRRRRARDRIRRRSAFGKRRHRQVARVAARGRANAAICAASRPQSTVGCPVRARCTASAVPHEPAPSTAIAGRATASTAASFEVVTRTTAARGQLTVAALGCCAAACCAARGMQGFERHERQQERREAALGHQIRDRRARVRQQVVRRHDREDLRDVGRDQVLDHERAGLLQLEQPHHLVAGLGFEVHLHHDFVQVLRERGRARGDVQVHRGLAFEVADERAVRGFERTVLEVDDLRRHHRGIGVDGGRLGVLVGHRGRFLVTTWFRRGRAACRARRPCRGHRGRRSRRRGGRR